MTSSATPDASTWTVEIALFENGEWERVEDEYEAETEEEALTLAEEDYPGSTAYRVVRREME